ncbi:MAG: hypothetical protein ACJZ8X_04545 [Candidatus Puniceispirillales bacterium]
MAEKNEDKYKQFSNKLLDWYDIRRRTLPWRAAPGEISNPYLFYCQKSCYNKL